MQGNSKLAFYRFIPASNEPSDHVYMGIWRLPRGWNTPQLAAGYFTYERQAEMIRPAEEKDISRIAEILIFTKRMTYRPIFRNDKVSFGEMQVLPLAEEYKKHPERLAEIWVYEEEFVKGMITLQTTERGNGSKTVQIRELYVDVFFHNEGIGKKLLGFAVEMAVRQRAEALFLWVLEKNERACTFYRKNGFRLSGDRMLEEGTEEYIVGYRKELCN